MPEVHITESVPDSPATAELASEHHDRITEVEHEAEQAAAQADAAAREALDVTLALAGKADVNHEHPDKVSHAELEDRLSRFRAEFEQPTAPSEESGEGNVSVLPLPEPEPEPRYRQERRHGRSRRVRAS